MFLLLYIMYSYSYSNKTIVRKENITLLFISRKIINEFSLLFGGGRRQPDVVVIACVLGPCRLLPDQT